jgi:glutamate synthase domain-containing protein 1
MGVDVCGIAGLHLKEADLDPYLGALLAPMIEALTTRGPDSAGIALYDDSVPAGALRWTQRARQEAYIWSDLVPALRARTDADTAIEVRADVALLTSTAPEDHVRAILNEFADRVDVVGVGQAMTLFKDVGSPREICDRYGIGGSGGYQGVGHTRMATESAVTTQHSHPFSPAADLALVHNGSFSNHASIRRRLEDRGVRFETDNDSEVAARFIGEQLSDGESLSDAMRFVVKEFDGFFTLLVSSRDEFAVVRDAFACKPLVVAETDSYVAVASEYHALAQLPGIQNANVFEPQPEEVHAWARS